MIKAIIVDDEPLAHRVIERFAVDVPFLDIVGQCYLATEAYPLLATQSVDLIFLDVNMPKVQGLDFLRSLEKKPHIILCTAYEEFALEAFDLQVVDYLLKPFSFERFLKAVNIVQSRINKGSEARQERANQIFLKVDKRFIHIDVQDIQCLESYGNYVKVWLDNDMLLTPRTLSSLEKELKGMGFQRVHKSFIIQRSYVRFVEGHVIHLKNGKEIPVGKNYRAEVRSWF